MEWMQIYNHTKIIDTVNKYTVYFTKLEEFYKSSPGLTEDWTNDEFILMKILRTTEEILINKTKTVLIRTNCPEH